MISSNGSDYYAYILLYFNGILYIHHNANSVLTKIDKYFKLKTDSVRETAMYLGAKVRLTKLKNGVCYWALIP